MKTMLIAATMAMAAAAAQAQTPAHPMMACRADVARLCADKAKGPERRQCIMGNYSQLSDGCKTAISTMRQQRQAAKTATPAPAPQ